MRTAVILGASRGIGLGCARRLAEGGARALLFARSEAGLNEAKAELDRSGAEVLTRAGDLSSQTDLEQLFLEVSERFGGCDILVNNNGGPPAGQLLSLSDDDWTRTFSTFALPVFRAIRLAVPSMKQKSWGRIITIGSLSAKQPIDNLDLSNFVRAGFAGITKTLSRALAPHHITVHLVCPGSIATERSQKRIAERAQQRGISYEESLKISESSIPAGRLGTAEEVGDLVAYLASDHAAYLTGNIIQIDGGQSGGLL